MPDFLHWMCRLSEGERLSEVAFHELPVLTYNDLRVILRDWSEELKDLREENEALRQTLNSQ